MKLWFTFIVISFVDSAHHFIPSSENVAFRDHESKFLKDGTQEIEYKIVTTWDSIQVMHAPVTIRFKPGDQGLVMEVSSLFFDDPPAPPGEPGKPFDGLWDYEGMVSILYYDSLEEIVLKTPVARHNHFIWFGTYSNEKNTTFFLPTVKKMAEIDSDYYGSVTATCQRKGLELAFKADINWGNWNGSAIIPWGYFPPGVDKMNSYAIHGSGNGRIYEALYPIPREEIKEGQGPNFHLLEYFKDFHLKDIMGEDWNQPPSDW